MARRAPAPGRGAEAYQALGETAGSRQNAVIFTGRTYDLPLFPQIMPEYAGINRPNNRPKPRLVSHHERRPQ